MNYEAMFPMDAFKGFVICWDVTDRNFMVLILFYIQGQPLLYRGPRLFFFGPYYIYIYIYIYIDDAFFQPELCWSVLGSLGRTWTAAGLVCRLLDVILLCKMKKAGGSAGASPVAAQMPKSVSSSERIWTT